MQTSLGEMEFEFAFGGWVMIAWRSRTIQEQCRSRRDLAQVLERLGLSQPEASSVASEAWKGRPRDASMDTDTDSQSVVMAIGNQWIAAAVVVLLVIAFTIVLLGR